MSTHSENNARNWCESIEALVTRLHGDDYRVAETSREEIIESALEVSVRSHWQSPGEPLVPDRYRILLTYGGPALQITGALDDYMNPRTAALEHQDWGEPWQWFDEADEEVLLSFAQVFYFGA